ncbi:MAG TPA: NAD-dependent epimerase/dehydratase family protein [Myxococcota bacterium]|nr:NAD-dependent epimerase/dehydratase family protein [Myxococcota bacterium]
MDTLFVTGGTGFIGAAFVRRAVAAGHAVQALARTAQSAQKLRAAGAAPVLGDLGDPGGWREAAAAADGVVHLAQPETFGARITLKRAQRYEALRLRLDAALLDTLRPERTRRVLYVCGTNYYGDQGTHPRDEDALPNPRGWGRYVAAAVDALAPHAARGLAIVEAYPGWVYGAGSWFSEYILAPMRRGLPLMLLAGPDRLVPPVHVEDCAAALLHLYGHGAPGRRYFVVDDRPSPVLAMLELAASTLGVRLRTWRAPRWLYEALAGPVVAESSTYDCALSNARLRATGFVPRFPTVDTGVPDVARRWLEAR